MEREPHQLDLFLDGHREGLAPRSTQTASKQALRSLAKEPSPSSFEAQRSTDRDENNIVRFPVDRWAPSLWQGKVEKVARLLRDRKTERGRQNLWRTTVESLFAQMRRRGATGAEIEKQIDDFHAAVSWSLSDQQSGPGAA